MDLAHESGEVLMRTVEGIIAGMHDESVRTAECYLGMHGNLSPEMRTVAVSVAILTAEQMAKRAGHDAYAAGAHAARVEAESRRSRIGWWDVVIGAMGVVAVAGWWWRG